MSSLFESGDGDGDDVEDGEEERHLGSDDEALLVGSLSDDGGADDDGEDFSCRLHFALRLENQTCPHKC